MQDTNTILINRFSELSSKGSLQRRAVYSDFLTIDEQNVLLNCKTIKNAFLWGGVDTAERKLACFSYDASEEKIKLGCPAVWVKIEPVSKKFADALSHRDFLGTLMGLGIRRETFGDIIISGNCGYVFCLKKIAEYITENLDRIRRTSVKCKISELPFEISNYRPSEEIIIVSSVRIDAVIASVFKLSRADSQTLFMQNKVYINGKNTNNSSLQLSGGEIVSVRGLGRFMYYEAVGETKKSRLKIKIGVYK